jgi:hypothetical protein
MRAVCAPVRSDLSALGGRRNSPAGVLHQFHAVEGIACGVRIGRRHRRSGSTTRRSGRLATCPSRLRPVADGDVSRTHVCCAAGAAILQIDQSSRPAEELERRRKTMSHLATPAVWRTVTSGFVPARDLGSAGALRLCFSGRPLPREGIANGGARSGVAPTPTRTPWTDQLFPATPSAAHRVRSAIPSRKNGAQVRVTTEKLGRRLPRRRVARVCGLGSVLLNCPYPDRARTGGDKPSPTMASVVPVVTTEHRVLACSHISADGRPTAVQICRSIWQLRRGG